MCNRDRVWVNIYEELESGKMHLEIVGLCVNEDLEEYLEKLKEIYRPFTQYVMSCLIKYLF